jgi:hypothetical protein
MPFIPTSLKRFASRRVTAPDATSDVDLRSTIERLCAAPGFAVVTTVSGAVAGVLGSIYALDIRDSFRPFWMGQFAPWPTAFWVAVLLFGVFFGATQWAHRRIAARSEQALVAKSSELSELILDLHSLPPEGFLLRFERQFSLAYTAARTAVERADKDAESIELAIRVVLDSVVALAKLFEKERDAVYSANVMLFRSLAGASDPVVSAVRAQLLFVPDATDPRALQGVLQVVPALSTTTRTLAPDPDASLQPIALPVPARTAQNQDSARRSNVLPGAPWAYFYNEPVGFATLAELVEWCRSRGDFAPAVIDAIGKYFDSGAGKDIKSFISMPLFPPAATDGEPASQTVGVLNLHCSQEGLLARRGAQRFVPMMAPFRAVVTQLVGRLPPPG